MAAGRTAPDAAARVADAGARLRSALARTIRLTEPVVAEAATLSEAYRADGSRTLEDARSAVAYAASRMPATFAATARTMAAGADRLPGFAPRSLLDVGAGTGATTWAARAVWPSIRDVTLVEREAAALDLGRRLLDDARTTWQAADVGTVPFGQVDLATAGYVLGELDAAARRPVVERLWAATRGALVLVEPGSRAGFERILEARSALIGAGARIAAPCPGDRACPVAAGPAWCHFLARLDRSPLQKRAKSAARSWEDEPYAYVVAARPSVVADPRPRVVLGRPRHRPGLVEVRVCADGRIETVVRSRRDGEAYRIGRDLAWGDVVPSPVIDEDRPEG
ncbi:MAG TPA: small ribosomal subunit Rsm22 family protein [Candidatus Limnocylindrales bacterium]